MSGHSHWKTIKYKKGAADEKRGKLFSKLSRAITAAAKQGGADPAFNSRLRLAIDQARSFNMPSENIERAIKKAEGAGGEKLEEALFEGFGPENSTLLIFVITDNTKRALGDVRQILTKYGGKIGEPGSVRWLYEQRGVSYASQEKNHGLSLDDIELKAIEAGASDVVQKDNRVEIISPPQDLENTKNNLTALGVVVDSSRIEWTPKTRIILTKEGFETYKKLVDELQDLEDVQEVYSNVEIDV